MRVYLIASDLNTELGKELLELATRIAMDGDLDRDEIIELRRWLRVNKDNICVAAVKYLNDIMTRIVSDGVIDRDELIELHQAVERVIPASHRTPIVQARKNRETERRERMKERLRVQKQKQEERHRQRHYDPDARQGRLLVPDVLWRDCSPLQMPISIPAFQVLAIKE